MDRELVEFYKRELAVIYEQAGAFAEEYPGIADRLGGLARERGDPMIAGLLEGVALLAARVQLKLKHEFSEFTFNMLDHLLPNYMAPMPSIMLAEVAPPFGEPDLRNGRAVPAGALLDATYRDKDRNIACAFTLCEPIPYWPFDLPRADYAPSSAPLQALGLQVGPEVAAGLKLSLRLRTSAAERDEPPEDVAIDDPGARISGCSMDSLTIRLLGAEDDAVALYEQIFAQRNGVALRYLDSFGDPKVILLPPDCVEQIGFGPEERLMPYESRLFRGFELLQEYVAFPRKFLGFRLKGLRQALQKIDARVVDIILTFDQSNLRLAAAVQPSMFSLHAAPAVNLFRKTADRVTLAANRHEHQVIPDRTQYLGYEPHRVVDVHLHVAGQDAKQRVHPVYRSTLDGAGEDRRLFYSVRRLERRRTARERRGEGASRYAGTDMYIAISPPGGGVPRDQRPELSITLMCSNRHLAEFLPVGRGGADFRLRDNTALAITAAIMPTAPRDAPLTWRHEQPQQATVGRMAWQVINLLNLNHLGIGESDGRGLREALSLFADLADPIMARRIRGVRGVAIRAVTRRLPQRAGVGAARGLEVELLLEDKAFEGSGAFLMGAVIERFFLEYVGLNHFVQTVVKTVERGVIARWPARSGGRGAL